MQTTAARDAMRASLAPQCLMVGPLWPLSAKGTGAPQISSILLSGPPCPGRTQRRLCVCSSAMWRSSFKACNVQWPGPTACKA